MKKKFQIRHKVLGYLKFKMDRKLSVMNDLNLSTTEVEKLAKDLNYSYDEINKYHHAMHDKEHVKCFVNDGKHYIGLLEPGIGAYIDEYWLREGERELNERIYDKTKWLVPTLAILLSAGATIYSILSTQAIKDRLLILEQQNKIKQEQQHTLNPKATKTSDSLPDKE